MEALDEVDEVDVVVMGGGAAGICAAVEAGRGGVSVLLVEKSAQLGGTTTSGGVNGIQSFFAYGKQVIAGIGWELVCRTAEVLGKSPREGEHYKETAGVTTTIVDRAIYSAVADEAVLESGARMRLHTMLGAVRQEGSGWRLTLCGKEGLFEVRAKTVVDATGDCNVVSLAGLEVRRHRERQPATLVMKLAGYDAKGLDYAGIQGEFEAAMARGEVRASDAGWQHGKIENFLKWYGGNCVHVISDEAADSVGRTKVELEARRVMLRLVKFLRRQKGLEDFRVEWFAPEVGVRETVTVLGRTEITCEDYMSGRVYADAVCTSFYPIDKHTEKGVDYRPLKEGVVPTIPFGAMLPMEGRNVVVAGRCVAGDREAFSAYRVQATCMATGQVAGAACALAVKKGCEVADVDLAELREVLRGHGAVVPG